VPASPEGLSRLAIACAAQLIAGPIRPENAGAMNKKRRKEILLAAGILVALFAIMGLLSLLG
jgi:hypothetical protein